MLDNTINRFKKAQEHSHRKAKKELLEGEKQSHWMWYTFPQLKGLGYSMYSKYYGIDGREEALLYLRDDVLRKHLLELCEILLSLPESNAIDIFGYPDNLKLQSSMTLFDAMAPEYTIFRKILNKFFNGEPDYKTLQMLSSK